jgi:hypothetical protein
MLTHDNHVKRVRAVVRGNHCLTVREVAKWASAQVLAVKFLLKNFRCITSVQNSCSRVTPHPQLSDKTDFFLFPKLKTTLKVHHFQTIEEIQENVIRELCAITESVFQ